MRNRIEAGGRKERTRRQGVKRGQASRWASLVGHSCGGKPQKLQYFGLSTHICIHESPVRWRKRFQPHLSIGSIPFASQPLGDSHDNHELYQIFHRWNKGKNLDLQLRKKKGRPFPGWLHLQEWQSDELSDLRLSVQLVDFKNRI